MKNCNKAQLPVVWQARINEHLQKQPVSVGLLSGLPENQQISHHTSKVVDDLVFDGVISSKTLLMFPREICRFVSDSIHWEY